MDDKKFFITIIVIILFTGCLDSRHEDIYKYPGSSAIESGNGVLVIWEEIFDNLPDRYIKLRKHFFEINDFEPDFLYGRDDGPSNCQHPRRNRTALRNDSFREEEAASENYMADYREDGPSPYGGY